MYIHINEIAHEVTGAYLPVARTQRLHKCDIDNDTWHCITENGEYVPLIKHRHLILTENCTLVRIPSLNAYEQQQRIDSRISTYVKGVFLNPMNSEVVNAWKKYDVIEGAIKINQIYRLWDIEDTIRSNLAADWDLNINGLAVSSLAIDGENVVLENTALNVKMQLLIFLVPARLKEMLVKLGQGLWRKKSHGDEFIIATSGKLILIRLYENMDDITESSNPPHPTDIYKVIDSMEELNVLSKALLYRASSTTAPGHLMYVADSSTFQREFFQLPKQLYSGYKSGDPVFEDCYSVSIFVSWGIPLIPLKDISANDFVPPLRVRSSDIKL